MAETIAERDGLLPIFDGHNDVLLTVYGGYRDAEPRSFFARGEKGHIDLPRAREGGFAGGFFAVWVPPDPASRRPSLEPAIVEPETEDPSLAPAVPQTFALRMPCR